MNRNTVIIPFIVIITIMLTWSIDKITKDYVIRTPVIIVGDSRTMHNKLEKAMKQQLSHNTNHYSFFTDSKRGASLSDRINTAISLASGTYGKIGKKPIVIIVAGINGIHEKEQNRFALNAMRYIVAKEIIFVEEPPVDRKMQQAITNFNQMMFKGTRKWATYIDLSGLVYNLEDAYCYPSLKDADNIHWRNSMYHLVATAIIQEAKSFRE